MFGHKILLNFNEKGSTHNTVLGGLFSLFLKLLVLVYIQDCCAKLFSHDDDVNLSYDQLVDLEDLGVVEYNSTGVYLFYNVNKILASK